MYALRFLFLALWPLCSAFAAQAQSTHQLGRAVIDLPADYKLQPQRAPTLYIFAGAGPQIIIEVSTAESSIEGHFDAATDNIKGSLNNMEPIVAPTNYSLNGLPARWGVHKGSVHVESAKSDVPVFAAVGAVRLQQGGVRFTAFCNDKQKEWLPKLRNMFHTLRAVGEPVTGPTAPVRSTN